MRLKIKLRIKDMPVSSRPREKMEAQGRSHLSDGELLAILLGSGSVKQNVLKLSEKLLSEYPLKKLANAKASQLIAFAGIGKSKASRILAALELGERVYSPEMLGKVLVRSTEDAVDQLKEFSQKKQEHLVVLYLNARHELLQKETIGIGSLNSMVITPKEIYGPALQLPCASIIIAHNHPSGDPDPSDDDIKFTQRVHEAGEVLGIRLVDHIVITKASYFSFRENKIGT
ncbi:MAG: DNA repair protein RadC [Candidatus Levybacteria bacterium]|nr:DNA repair protein RadC [Candidatus Levybacteria bacterium]